MTAAGSMNGPKPVHAKILIGGEWTDSNRHIEVFNPARPDELVGTIPRCGPEDVDRAIVAAKAAQPDWASRSYSERAQILAPTLERLAAEMDERTVLYVRENGKTAAEARAELAGVPARQRLTLELAAQLDARQEFGAPNGKSFVGYLPYGVVVSIVPWNAPVSLRVSADRSGIARREHRRGEAAGDLSAIARSARSR